MSATYKESSQPPSQGSYMQSAEFDNVRGVPAVPVSFRAAALLTARKRDFIWWLQGLSLKEGGFKCLARELLEMFPTRIGTPDMHRAVIEPGKMYPGDLGYGVEVDLDSSRWDFSEEARPKINGSDLIQLCRRHALTFRERKKSPFANGGNVSIEQLSVEQFLVELCTNPKIQFSLPGIEAAGDELEIELATEADPELRASDFKRAELVYFHDIIGALVEYRARHEKQKRDDFHLTAIGKQIWETLDYALASRSMVLLDGLEGRGKTEAVKAWCELHQGQARFVSLKGVTNKTTVFREIAFALGITYAYGRTGPEMQARVEDVLKRSGIMLLIDEAHFLLNQTRRMTGRPEMIDWLDTAIANRGLPVALCTTPQFIACMARAKNQVEYNFNQFRRRVKRWVKLPDKNSESDIAAVARKVFQGAGEPVIKKIVGYALLSKRDLSAVGDVAAEVRAMLGMEDLSRATVAHVHRAITEFLIPSDQAFKVSLDAAESAQRPGRRRPAPALPSPVEEDEPMEKDRQPASVEITVAPAPDRARGSVAIQALETANPATSRGGLKAVLTPA